MRILFTFILTVAFGATGVYAQNSNTAVKTKAKAEVSQTSKAEFQASEATKKASSFTKDNLRAQQNQPATKALNNDLERVNKEIEAVETRIKARSTKETKAEKANLEKLKAEKHKLKVKTL